MKFKMIALSFTLALTLTLTVVAHGNELGPSRNELTCVSDSGLRISGHYSLDTHEIQMTISKDGQSQVLDESNVRWSIHDEARDKIWVLTLESLDVKTWLALRIHAIPDSYAGHSVTPGNGIEDASYVTTFNGRALYYGSPQLYGSEVLRCTDKYFEGEEINGNSGE